MKKVNGMNILELIEFYINEYHMSEEDAEKMADLEFEICEN